MLGSCTLETVRRSFLLKGSGPSAEGTLSDASDTRPVKDMAGVRKAKTAGIPRPPERHSSVSVRESRKASVEAMASNSKWHGFTACPGEDTGMLASNVGEMAQILVVGSVWSGGVLFA